MVIMKTGGDHLKRKKNKWLGRLGLCAVIFTPTALFAAPITGVLLEVNNASSAVIIATAAIVATVYFAVLSGGYVLHNHHR